MTYSQPQPTEASAYVGIDVSKRELVVAVRCAGQTDKPRTYPNTPAGIAKLCRRIAAMGAVTEVCMEATGHYGMAAALSLHTQGHRVSVENPMCIKAFMHSTMRRNKTDSADAAAIAEYAERMPTRPWKPRPAARKRLHQALCVRDLLIKATGDIKRQLKSGAVEEVSEHPRATIAMLTERHTAIEDDLKATVASCPQLTTTVALLLTIPGFGKVAAWTMAADVDIDDFDNAKKLAASLGVTPQRRQSGSGGGSTRLSKQGNPRLRRVLYMGAISAMRSNPHIRVCAERWRSPEGKGNGRPLTGRQAACAAMHKLTRIAYGVLKSGKPYESGKFCEPRSA